MLKKTVKNKIMMTKLWWLINKKRDTLKNSHTNQVKKQQGRGNLTYDDTRKDN